MDSWEKIDYLAIGHICHDIMPQGKMMGGAAAYASAVASAAGCSTAVVTSSAVPDNWRRELPRVKIHQVPSPQTTVFENIKTPSGRVQILHSVANRIHIQDIPAAWRRASIVHIAPIANEVDPDVVGIFSNSLVGLAPQGWMRRWDQKGQVFIISWPQANKYFDQAAVVFLSEEDIVDKDTLDIYKKRSHILVLTRGRQGCSLFLKGEEYNFPAESVSEIDTTGAGDIFASAFLIRFFQTAGNHLEAAKFANKAAALSIGHIGIESKVDALKNLYSN